MVHSRPVFTVLEPGLAPVNKVCPHKVRTENKNTMGMFTSLGKASKHGPHEGNLVGDNTGVEEEGPKAGRENRHGRGCMG